MRTRRALVATFALLASLGIDLAVPRTAAADGVAYRVADLRTAPHGGVYQVDATELESAGGRAYFVGNDGTHGSELWISDGTTVGSAMIADLQTAAFGSEPRELLAWGASLYFTACTPAFGCEPWRSDGTAAGTALLADVWPGPGSSYAKPIAVVQGQFFFAGADAEHGTELWVSDGTSAGTRLVADIQAGADSGLETCYADDRFSRGLGLAGRLYFTAYDSAHGCELWRSDGTPAGTYLLKSLIPGSQGGGPTAYRRVGSQLYFAGSDDAHGFELWVTDGSAQGTRLVRDLVPGPASSTPTSLGAIGDRLLFAAGADYALDLWSTDGTSSGTQVVRSFSAPDANERLNNAGVEVAGRVVFCVFDPVHGLEPWTTDGTPAGTSILADLAPGSASSWACEFGVGHEGAYIFGRNGAIEKLWLTDGTPAGTTFVAAFEQPDLDLYYLDVAAAAGGTLVRACDESYGPTNCRLWRTDGTPAGTQRLFAESEARSASNPHHLNARPGGLVLEAYLDTPSQYLVRSDGTEAGTFAMTIPLQTGLYFHDRAQLASGELVLMGVDADGYELWRTDGDGFAQVSDLESGPESSYPVGFERVGDLVYLVAVGDDSFGLWTTDGTASGTVRAAADLYAEYVIGAFDRAWFAGERYVGGEFVGSELWESSGTEATTFPHDVVPGPDSSSPSLLVAIESPGGAIAFHGAGPNCEDDVIYQYDLATDEAHAVRLLAPEAGSYDGPSPIAGLGGRLYFFDLAPDGACALFASEGTAEATTRVKHVGSGTVERSHSLAHCPTRLVSHAGVLYFTACGPLAGCELWRSDGTTAGTNRVTDLVPGPGSSFPSQLASIGDRLYFEACTPVHGCEPWVTDGSAAGLHRLADIAPGAASASPGEFTESEGLVYFAADDGTGAELWAMPLEIFYDGFESGDFSRW